ATTTWSNGPSPASAAATARRPARLPCTSESKAIRMDDETASSPAGAVEPFRHAPRDLSKRVRLGCLGIGRDQRVAGVDAAADGQVHGDPSQRLELPILDGPVALAAVEDFDLLVAVRAGE